MKAFVFDTETTGLINNRTIKLDKQPEIIEFYGCLVDLKKGKVLKEIDELICPTTPDIVTKEITKITGLSYEKHLKGAPPIGQVFNKIKGAIEKAPLIIAHNLSFDTEMVDIEAQRLSTKIAWPKAKLCTVEQTIHLKGKRLSLSNLHELLFNEKFVGAHRAKVDVQALVRCCVELHKRDVI